MAWRGNVHVAVAAGQGLFCGGPTLKPRQTGVADGGRRTPTLVGAASGVWSGKQRRLRLWASGLWRTGGGAGRRFTQDIARFMALGRRTPSQAFGRLYATAPVNCGGRRTAGVWTGACAWAGTREHFGRVTKGLNRVAPVGANIFRVPGCSVCLFLNPWVQDLRRCA